MYDLTEIAVTNKYLDHQSLEDINNIAVDLALRSININSCWMPAFSNLPEKCAVNINSDLFFSNDSPEIRHKKVSLYPQQYRNFNFLNIGPCASLLIQSKWSDIAKDLEAVSDRIREHSSKILPRLWIDCSFMASEEEIFRLSDLAEQSGMGEVIIGSTHSKRFALEDVFLVAARTKPHLSIPVGIFGNISDKEIFEHVERAELNSVIMSPNNIFRLFAGD